MGKRREVVPLSRETIPDRVFALRLLLEGWNVVADFAGAETSAMTPWLALVCTLHRSHQRIVLQRSVRMTFAAEDEWAVVRRRLRRIRLRRAVIHHAAAFALYELGDVGATVCAFDPDALEVNAAA